MSLHGFQPGEFAEYDGSVLVVAQQRQETAGECIVPTDDDEVKTVADYHDDTPGNDLVVDCIFVSDLDANVPGWRAKLAGYTDVDGREAGWIQFDDWLGEFEKEWRVSLRRYSLAETQLKRVEYEVVGRDD